MSRTSTIRFRWLGGVAAFALIAAGGVALSPVASGAPGIDAAKKFQPRAYQYGNWAQVGSGFMTGPSDTRSQVYQLTSRSQFPDLDDTPGPTYVAGTFISSGATAINRVGRLAVGGSQWTPLPNDDTGIAPGVPQTTDSSVVPGVYGLALSGDDSLYIGGSFWGSDDTLNNVGHWNGSDWVRMGIGLRSGASGNFVQDMVVGNDFIGGDDMNYADDTIYALGGFVGTCSTLRCDSATPALAAKGIAQYSQADDTWYQMGDGTLSGSGAQVFAGAYIDDTLYVGGKFTAIGGVQANGIARWSEPTDTWLPLGTGIGPAGQEVTAMAVNPITRDLYVGGNFTTAGALTGLPGIVKWDYRDDTWYTVGTGLTGGVVDDISFSPDGNTVYLGMFGGSVDGITANYVARMTSTEMSSDAATNISAAWDYIKSSGVVGVNGAARTALAQADGSVMFAGNFSQAGAVSAGRVATFTPGAEPSPYDPVFPPGPPTDVVATGGFRTITVDWKAPTYTGSYPITNYLVTSSPGNRVCISSLSDVKLTQCVFRDLTPGTRYTFTVQGLNGGGWGERSAASNVATPSNLRIVAADRKVTKFLGIVTGSEVRAAGIAPGFAPGTKLVPWTKIGSGEWVAVTNSGLTVNAEEKFTWKRKFGRKQNSQPVAIRFEIGGNFTNTVNFQPVK